MVNGPVNENRGCQVYFIRAKQALKTGKRQRWSLYDDKGANLSYDLIIVNCV